MKAWIEKNLSPAGIEKKNRGALYTFIARVLEQVKKDAETSFNARFPYATDERKLPEHGEALFIPRLEGDGPTEYRDRVAAAAFYLSRTGERGYIRRRLDAHFKRFTNSILEGFSIF
jgi:hypothetical protein